jgi:hypothetical protein
MDALTQGQKLRRINMEYYTILDDTETFSDLNGSSVAIVAEDNTVKVYDLEKIILHLQNLNLLNQFLTDIQPGNDFIEAFEDNDRELTRILPE